MFSVTAPPELPLSASACADERAESRSALLREASRARSIGAFPSTAPGSLRVNSPDLVNTHQATTSKIASARSRPRLISLEFYAPFPRSQQERREVDGSRCLAVSLAQREATCKKKGGRSRSKANSSRQECLAFRLARPADLRHEHLTVLIDDVEVDRVAHLKVLSRQIALPLGRVVPVERKGVPLFVLDRQGSCGSIDVGDFALVRTPIGDGNRAHENKSESRQ